MIGCQWSFWRHFCVVFCILNLNYFIVDTDGMADALRGLEAAWIASCRALEYVFFLGCFL